MPPPILDYDSRDLAFPEHAADPSKLDSLSVDISARGDSSIRKDETRLSTKEATGAPLQPSYEGCVFTVLDPATKPGETVSWIRTHRTWMSLAYERDTGLTPSEQYKVLGPNQQAIVRRYIDEKNAAEKDVDVVWELFGLQWQYKEFKTTLSTWKVNVAIIVILQRGERANHVVADLPEGYVSFDDIDQTDLIDLSEPFVENEVVPGTSSEKLDIGNASGESVPHQEEAAATNTREHKMSHPYRNQLREQERAQHTHPYEDRPWQEEPTWLRRAEYENFSTAGESARLHLGDITAPSVRYRHRDENVPEEGWCNLATHRCSTTLIAMTFTAAESEQTRNPAWKCVHRGCGKIFVDSKEQCNYHRSCNAAISTIIRNLFTNTFKAGIPVFHKGEKGYTCCKIRVLTFDEFLTIAPCTMGHHTTVDDTPSEAHSHRRQVKFEPRPVLSPHSRSSSAHSSASSAFSRTSLPLSQFSMASSKTSAGSIASIAQYSGLMHNITKGLICTEELEPILAGAFNDSEIGAGRLQTNMRRMIQHLGKNLRLEVEDKTQLDTSRALKSPKLSSHAAKLVLQHMETMATKPMAEEPMWIESENEKNGDFGGDSSDGLDEDDEKELSTTEYRDIHDFLINSKAYDTFKADLLDFMHKPYERRIMSAFGAGVIGSRGEALHQDVTHSVAREVSWIPTRLLELSHNESSSYGNAVKGFIEHHMGETWTWWPLAPRLPGLRPGYFRMKWKSVCAPRLFSAGMEAAMLTFNPSRAASLAT